MSDLVLNGEVVSIDPFPDPERRKRWRVTMKVAHVDCGTFDGETFAFLVHSPIKSGLAIGGRYTVRADSTDDGYLVDEWQWLTDRFKQVNGH